MTVDAWLMKAFMHKERLRTLIQNYHPMSKQQRPRPLPITAPNVEVARRHALEEMIPKLDTSDPVALFDEAMENKDIGSIFSLLDQTWLAVPESTSCWRITGFPEAVDLLGDFPDGSEESVEHAGTKSSITKGGRHEDGRLDRGHRCCQERQPEGEL